MVEITDPDRYQDPISRSSAPGRTRRQISWKFVLSLSPADAPGLTNGGDFPNGAQDLLRVYVKRYLLVGRKTFLFSSGERRGETAKVRSTRKDVFSAAHEDAVGLPSHSCRRRRKVSASAADRSCLQVLTPTTPPPSLPSWIPVGAKPRGLTGAAVSGLRKR